MQEVAEKIQSCKVLLLSKEYCPFCQKAKAVLTGLQVPFEVVELMDTQKQPLVEDPEAVMDYMQKLTGGRTVPRLFIAGKFIGGCEPWLQTLRHLDHMLIRQVVLLEHASS